VKAIAAGLARPRPDGRDGLRGSEPTATTPSPSNGRLGLPARGVRHPGVPALVVRGVSTGSDKVRRAADADCRLPRQSNAAAFRRRVAHLLLRYPVHLPVRRREASWSRTRRRALPARRLS
jgi:hypothetical protein